jgi:hypothetical protein
MESSFYPTFSYFPNYTYILHISYVTRTHDSYLYELEQHMSTDYGYIVWF